MPAPEYGAAGLHQNMAQQACSSIWHRRPALEYGTAGLRQNMAQQACSNI